MSAEMDTAIALFSGTNQPPGIMVKFHTNLDGICKAELNVFNVDGKYWDRLSNHEIKDWDRWTRFCAAIGRSEALRILDLSVYISPDDNISSEVYRCVEAFYNGLTKNCSIEKLKLSTNVFSGDGNLPILDLNNAKFKDSLKEFEATASVPISNNESIIISSFLENTSLATFNLWGLYSDESAFRRIASACYTVNKLRLTCRSDAQYASIASLLGNDRSVMEELQIDGIISKEQLSTIAAALVNNESLKKLKLHDEWNLRNSEGDFRPMTKTLCDASSIEGICASNHTLQEVFPLSMSPMVWDCLRLNKNANKDKVIRKKIARYYFAGDFDISPFAKMPVSLLPEVLSMIRSRRPTAYHPDSMIQSANSIMIQSAIFRILKYIPDLCNVSSRVALHNDHDDEYKSRGSGFNKRSNVSK
eukprot:scaffold108453_cov38-Cyclotella_meneghiniana.AAC.4